jgi:hypothetical protein
MSSHRCTEVTWTIRTCRGGEFSEKRIDLAESIRALSLLQGDANSP